MVFSLDSVITAVGMVDELYIMIAPPPNDHSQIPNMISQSPLWSSSIASNRCAARLCSDRSDGQRRRPFRDDDGRYMRVRRAYVGDDRRVDDTQTGHLGDSGFRSDDR